MDILLGKVTQQAMNYAIRSGVAITASFAIRQSSKLLSNTPKSNARDEFDKLQQRLQHKIHIVSPAIDLIELIAARGNTSLESAVALVKDLRLDIQSLGQRLARAAEASARVSRKAESRNSQARVQSEAELVFISKDIKTLLDRIEDAVPLINLAITTSGASLSTQLPQTVSPSRLLQASTFLTAGDTQYSISPAQAVQIGPTFTLTVYMLFAGHNRPQDEEELRETTWKEVIHKARVKLRRVPLDLVLGDSKSDSIPPAEISSPVKLPTFKRSTDGALHSNSASLRAVSRADEYAYQLLLVEDFEDDRVHDFSDTPESSLPGPFDDVAVAGIRETIPVHEVAKIFYADTSKVLNIGSDAESNHPVLLLKRDLNAVPPRRMVDNDALDTVDGEDQDDRRQSALDLQQGSNELEGYKRTTTDQGLWRFPPSLDPEWIAFEVYTESEPSDSDSDIDDSITQPEGESSPSQLAANLSHLDLESPSLSPSASHQIRSRPSEQLSSVTPWTSKIPTSLSLLELLLRLTSLQQFQQQSHLSITDELLTFFLEESASTGAGGDERYRQHLRQDARRRVGWDPYNESPVKRRGEDYQYGYGSEYGSPAAQSAGGASVNGTGRGWTPTSPRARDSSERMPQSVMSPLPTQSSSPMSPSPVAQTPGKAGRTAWLRREGDASRKGSPLRPRSPMTDEGIGTSPSSGVELGK